MTPQQLINAAYQVQQRWPDATISGRHGNATVSLEVIVDGMVLAWVNCGDGSIHEPAKPISAYRRIQWIHE